MPRIIKQPFIISAWKLDAVFDFKENQSEKYTWFMPCLMWLSDIWPTYGIHFSNMTVCSCWRLPTIQLECWDW